MDVKKAYRGAKAALRTAENEVVYLQDEVVDLRQCNLELYYDLRDAEERIANLEYQLDQYSERIAELQYLLDRYSERPTKAEAIRLAVRVGLGVVTLHALAWYLAAIFLI